MLKKVAEVIYLLILLFLIFILLFDLRNKPSPVSPYLASCYDDSGKEIPEGKNWSFGQCIKYRNSIRK